MYITVNRLAQIQFVNNVGSSKWEYDKKGKSDITVNGSGTKNDPIIIDQFFPKRFGLENSKHHISGKDLRFGICYLKNCKNLFFENCVFRAIKLADCSNIVFKSCIIFSELRMNDCKNMKYENCYIHSSFFYKSKQNTFLNSTFREIRDWSSNHTTFEGNKIHHLTINLKETTYEKRTSLVGTTINKQSYSRKGLFNLPPRYLLTKIRWWPIITYSVLFFLLLVFYIGFTASPNPYGGILGIILIGFPIIALVTVLPYSSMLIFYMKAKIKQE